MLSEAETLGCEQINNNSNHEDGKALLQMEENQLNQEKESWLLCVVHKDHGEPLGMVAREVETRLHGC